ncbi:hypothetical protein MCEMRE185_00493 [Candidatus Nanopelagicaceae bacterium]
MSDPIKVKHGNYVKGLMHLQRRDAAAAKAAFIEADDFPNARRQLPFIIKDLGGSPSEIIGALSAALDDGDMQALPWLIRFNDQFRYSHPDIKLFKKNLESAVDEENQSVLLGLMRIAREDRDVKEYLSLMIQLINLGNPLAKCEMVNFIMQGPEYRKEFDAMRKQQGKLPILNGVKANFKEIPKNLDEDSSGAREHPFLDKNDFEYLGALLDQGAEAIASGAHSLKYYLDMSMRRFETFPEYVQELTQSYDARWEDPHFLLIFAIDLHTYWPQYDMSVFRNILESYGLTEFLLQLSEEIQSVESESLFDDGLLIQLVRTPAKVSSEVALEFFAKYGSPLFDEFVGIFMDSPVAAGRKYSEFISKAMHGEAEYFQCTAAALEFIDRGYYDFDLVDAMLHGSVMRKLPALIESSPEISAEFLEYLYGFENGEAYFLDDIRRRIAKHPNTPKKVHDDFYSVM